MTGILGVVLGSIGAVTPESFTPYDTYREVQAIREILQTLLWWVKVCVYLVLLQIALKLFLFGWVGRLLHQVGHLLGLVEQHGEITDTMTRRLIPAMENVQRATEQKTDLSLSKAEDLTHMLEGVAGKVDTLRADMRTLQAFVARGKHLSDVARRPPGSSGERVEPPTPDPETPEWEVPK